jgi:D-glycero-D-manno-heptose 1,7-bisphosphate phosphatase
MKMEKKRILCLDLDGTVRRSKSGKTFIEGPDDIELIPGMKELIWKYKREGWVIVAITNQGGVAMGIKSHGTNTLELARTTELLYDGNEQALDLGFCCESHPEGRDPTRRFRSLNRKPYYGMLVEVEMNMCEDVDRFGGPPDWDNSLFVGDRPEDEECAKSASIPFMWAHDFVKQ